MSKYYAEIHGAAKTKATRRGHKSIKTYTASWNGAIETVIEDVDGRDFCTVWATDWPNRARIAMLWTGYLPDDVSRLGDDVRKGGGQTRSDAPPLYEYGGGYRLGH